MQIKRKSTAVWTGTGKEGKGKISSQSGVLSDSQYNFNSRFAEGTGTNPEELIAAAHAGCFSMKLAFNLQAAGFTADEISTSGEVILEDGQISASHLEVTASVPGIAGEKFAELVEDAKINCPVSKLLNCTITVKASLK